MRVFSQLGRVASPRPNGPPSLQALHSTFLYSTAASVRPHVSPCCCKPAIARPQLRVLRTQSNTTKGAQYPQYPFVNALPINWSTTVHRIRHISPSVMTTQTQTRSHAGHSHHHHDNTFLLSKNKNDAGVRITKIGLYVNLGMAISKGFGGYVFNSQGGFPIDVCPQTSVNKPSPHCRWHSQSYRPCQRHHDACDRRLVPQAALRPLP